MGRNVKTEYIPKFIMLLAGAIVCIVSIVKHMDTTYSLEILLAVLIVFYLIGVLARLIIEKVMVSNRFLKEKSDEPEEGREQKLMGEEQLSEEINESQVG